MGISHFIIIPCDQFIKTTIQRDPCTFIKNTGSGVTDEIGGNDLLIAKLNKFLSCSLGRFFNSITDVFISRLFTKPYGKVDD